MISPANQCTGFYMIGTSVMKELKKSNNNQIQNLKQPIIKKESAKLRLALHRIYAPYLSLICTCAFACLRALIIISTLFTIGFDLVKWTNKYQLTKLPSKDNESIKYLKGNYL